MAANILAFWYIRVLLGKLFFVGENLADLVDLITAYRKHLKGVYEMETFYGDETLKFLLEHTKSLNLLLEQYEDIYLITERIDEEEQEEQLLEESEQDAQTTISEENVFYAGTRASNN